MPTITVSVDDDLKERMDRHPEINWSAVTRSAIQEKIEHLEILDEIAGDSGLTESDVEELAERIDAAATDRFTDGREA